MTEKDFLSETFRRLGESTQKVALKLDKKSIEQACPFSDVQKKAVCAMICFLCENIND